MKNRILALAGVVVVVVVAVLLWNRSKSGETSQATTATTPQHAEANRKSRASNADDARAALAGQVLADDGSPLATATVQILPAGGAKHEPLSAYDAVRTTDEKGAFEYKDIPAGSYVVSASANGYLPAHQSIDLAPNANNDDLRLTLAKGGQRLHGLVRDRTGGSISAAIVQAVPITGTWLGESTRSVSTMSASDGAYDLNLADGRYYVWAYHDQYVPAAHLVHISGGDQDLDFDLAPGAVVEGIVKRSSDDQPVAGATVSYATEHISGLGLWASSTGTGQTQTDASGHFKITGLNSGTLTLSARGDGAVTEEATLVPLGIAEQRSDIELFVSSAYRISGRVVDAGSKAPAQDVWVSANSDGESVGALAPSDADGRFVIEALSPGKYRLSINSKRYMGSMFGVTVNIDDHDLSDVVLEVERGHSISGVVVPAVEAEVRPALSPEGGINPSLLRSTHSDAKGRFTIGPFASGDFELEARSDEGRRGSAAVSVKDRDLEGVRIELDDQGSLEGVVRSESGDPVDDVYVTLRQDTGNSSSRVIVNGRELTANRARTSPEGHYLIRGIVAGTYRLSVEDSQGSTLRWANEKASDPEAAKPRPLILADHESKTLNLTVEDRTATLAGVVLDPDGHPAADVWVTASPADDARRGAPGPGPADGPDADDPGAGEDAHEERTSISMFVGGEDGGDDESVADQPGLDLGTMGELPPTLTNEEGRFEIKGLRRGTYNLVAEGRKGSARAFLRGASTDSKIEMQLYDLTRLEGTVTLDGKPVTDFSVELSGHAHRSRRVRDSAGHFTMRQVDPGRYRVLVRSSAGEAELPVTVEQGEVAKVDIALEHLVTVQGRLVSDDGDGIGGALVAVVPQRDDGNVEIRLDGDAESTAPDGSFRTGVKPGKHMILFINPGSGPLAQKLLEVKGSEDSINLGEIHQGLPEGPPGAPDQPDEP